MKYSRLPVIFEPALTRNILLLEVRCLSPLICLLKLEKNTQSYSKFSHLSFQLFDLVFNLCGARFRLNCPQLFWVIFLREIFNREQNFVQSNFGISKVLFRLADSKFSIVYFCVYHAQLKLTETTMPKFLGKTSKKRLKMKISFKKVYSVIRTTGYLK